VSTKPSPKSDPDRVIIDNMVDWRKTNRPTDQSNIKVNLTPEVMLNCLKMPLPAGDKANYPRTCLYRGFRIEATKPGPQRERRPGDARKPKETEPAMEERRPYNDD
jgi:hypothetical protein